MRKLLLVTVYALSLGANASGIEKVQITGCGTKNALLNIVASEPSIVQISFSDLTAGETYAITTIDPFVKNIRGTTADTVVWVTNNDFTFKGVCNV